MDEDEEGAEDGTDGDAKVVVGADCGDDMVAVGRAVAVEADIDDRTGVEAAGGMTVEDG